jgi:hypothetical protein
MWMVREEMLKIILAGLNHPTTRKVSPKNSNTFTAAAAAAIFCCC